MQLSDDLGHEGTADTHGIPDICAQNRPVPHDKLQDAVAIEPCRIRVRPESFSVHILFSLRLHTHWPALKNDRRSLASHLTHMVCVDRSSLDGTDHNSLDKEPLNKGIDEDHGHHRHEDDGSLEAQRSEVALLSGAHLHGVRRIVRKRHQQFTQDQLERERFPVVEILWPSTACAPTTMKRWCSTS